MKILYSSEEIQSKVSELAKEISNDFRDKDVVLLGVLKGCLHFVSDIARKLDIQVSLEFIKSSSYGDSMTSSGNVTLSFDIPASLRNKHIIILEDIIDTGLTLNKIYSEVSLKNPESISVCALLVKKDKHEFSHSIRYKGFEVDDSFIVGYGLDYNEKYRNFSDLRILS
ncbi:MAG: hypoxanthine phosphoribosyltransferase [Leptospiraceae bacterium]|nr:hypoxanthine phosphoribosyltransferase [Leptospiraceae bacterium]MCP5512601.1 hypoxanthine phosphoribosyltransferase [Leptospiraceae bacterium]